MLKIILIAVILMAGAFYIKHKACGYAMQRKNKMDMIKILTAHCAELTMNIGERSVAFPDNQERAAAYIESVYAKAGIKTWREPYDYRGRTVDNIVAQVTGGSPGKAYLLGAHYDSVAGTVGADDNASAVAVQLMTAVLLAEEVREKNLDVSVRFVSFALEEPPAYSSKHMGSRVYVKKAKASGERIDGMICLEMVGYTCKEKGCQDYPLPLKVMDYPKTGDFIAVVGDNDSKDFTLSVYNAFRMNRGLPVIKLNVPLKGKLLPQIRLSDHASFWDAGYSAVMITDTAFYRNPHYHQSTDTMDTLDFSFMSEVAESLLLFFRNAR